MYIFVDESGDTGCNGSATQYFVIAIVIFDNIEDMQDTQVKIEEFKKLEHLTDELHFCKTPNNTKDKFFYFIKSCNFNSKAICVNKKELYSEFLINNPDKLYNYILKQLLDSLNTDKELKIILDGKGNRTLEKQLKQYLKTNSKLKVKKIKTKDSKSELLLQLADMIASCIGHSYNRKDKQNSDKWRKIISDKINIWNFR